MSPLVYLVSGASRGIGTVLVALLCHFSSSHSAFHATIGFGLVKVLATHEDTVVFAGARNPSTASQLNALAAKYPGKVHVVQLAASDESGNKAAIAQIKAIVGRLDIVIANTGQIFPLSTIFS
jgi:NAD(P)-dependent dehydrogenase (short-subunit alcohol dehydrogenase family)